MAVIPGRATAEGTARRRTRFEGHLDRGAYRHSPLGLHLSSIGLGTYLGEADDATDARYADAAAEAPDTGVNVFDTAINYRHQRSERSIGRALANLADAGELRRDELVVATKGGYVAFDGSLPRDPARWFHETFVASGILHPEDVAAGCHAMTPRYLEDQIGRSLANLRLETVDIYYLHNPETQLPEVGREEFGRRLRRSFEHFEQEVERGRIGCYGLATWNGFRVGPGAPDHLSLAETVRIAREVAGDGHHFGVVQLPFSLAMPEAASTPTQQEHRTASALTAQANGRPLVPFLPLAGDLGITVMTSASILQGRLARSLPQALAERIPGLVTDAQRALQFARSAPGVTTALVGMSRLEHARENAAVLGVPPLPEEEVGRVLEAFG